jgi:hypothetical protein
MQSVAAGRDARATRRPAMALLKVKSTHLAR